MTNTKTTFFLKSNYSFYNLQAVRGIFEEMKYLELMIVNDHKMVSWFYYFYSSFL